MTRDPIAIALKFWAIVFLLFAPLHAGGGDGLLSGVAGVAVRDIRGVIFEPATQWILVLCMACHFVSLSILGRRALGGRTYLQIQNPEVWLTALVLVALLRCLFEYEAASKSTQLSTLLASIVSGKAVLTWTRWRCRVVEANRRAGAINAILCLLTSAAFWRGVTREFQYRGVRRWSGAWENPNLYGLLMGVGTVLVIGLTVSSVGSRVFGKGGEKPNAECRTSNIQWKRRVRAVVCLIAASLCCVGLLKSYSRGAWIATICGVIYLVWRIVQSPRSHVQSRGILRLFRNWRVLVVIAVSLFAFSFWQFRFTEWRPARRVFSVANINDFSWRNRVTAWEGAIRMMANRPWIGFGWGKAELAYEKNYRPPQLENGAAIQMNDFFLLGISAGVPALVCFVVYVGLCLKSPKSRVQSPRSKVQSSKSAVPGPQPNEKDEDVGDRRNACTTLDWLQLTCRAGAIVLLVGFWFDGGLFKLATGSVFWILLELGRADTMRSAERGVRKFPESQQVQSVRAGETLVARRNGAQGTDAPYPRGRAEIWFRRFAWGVAGLAAVQTVVCVGTHFLSVSNGTLAIARRWLVPSSTIGDLDFLATNVSWDDSKLRVLVEHASLANYNRELINWKLDDDIYREYVLWPEVYQGRGSRVEGRVGDLNWRRALWEYFYPLVRHENDPEAAAEIVLKQLHQRVKIVEKGPLAIEEIWRQQMADAKGFEAISVAALRSVGVPARLNEDRQVELFADGKWQAVPRPVVSESLPPR